MNQIRIFISSPDDVKPERCVAEEVIDALNESDWARQAKVTCQALKWENDVVPKITGDINDEVRGQIGEYDIYVGIMSTRFGTPSATAGSGTEDEFNDAMAMYAAHERPWVMFYFHETSGPLISDPNYQLRRSEFARVTEFHERVKSKGLVQYYRDATDFGEKLAKHLRGAIEGLLNSGVLVSENSDAHAVIESAISSIEASKESRFILPRYVELNLVDEACNPAGSAIEVVASRLLEGDKLIAILGEFGTGKTSFCRVFSHKLAQQWKDGQSNGFTPMLFPLWSYDSSLGLVEWMAKELSQRSSSHIDEEALLRTFRSERVVLILDAFDEMPLSDRLSQSEAVEKISQLSELGPAVVVTCRTTFMDAACEWSRMRMFKRYYVDRFTRHQIVDCARRVLPRDCEQFIETVKGFGEPLKEISSRPLFLDMLIESYRRGIMPLIETPADLYSVLTSCWSQQESDKRSAILDPQERLTVVQELAFMMFTSNKSSVTLHEVSECILQHASKAARDVDIAACCNTIASSLFMDRTRDSKLRFSHQSFMEYFVAKKICEDLVEGRHVSLGVRILYEEIYEFVSLILEKNATLKPLLKTLLSPEASPIARAASVPPLRKLRSRESIVSLLIAHAQDSDAFVRYIAGYSAEIIGEHHHEDLTSCIQAENRRRMNADKNAIVRAVGERLMRGDDSQDFQWEPDLRPFCRADVETILQQSTVGGSYASLLTVGKEHDYALAEGVRLLALRAAFCEPDNHLDSSVTRFVLNSGRFSPSLRLRRASVWAIGVLRIKAPGVEFEQALEHALEDSNTHIAQLATTILSQTRAEPVESS